MNGKEFKTLLKLNGLRQEDAAKIFKVSRQTISVWCKSDKVDDKIVKLIFERFRVTDPSASPIESGTDGTTIDDRPYSSRNPDELLDKIDLLESRIKQQDIYIEKMLDILDKWSSFSNIISNLRQKDDVE